MDHSTLPLSTDQIYDLQNNGYLIVKNVLKEEEIKALLTEVDNVIEKHQSNEEKGKNTQCAHGKEYYNIHNPLEFTDKLDYLIDHEKAFDIITYLMGPYIQMMSCHIFVRHPSNSKDSNIGKFHTDSGPSLQRILPVPGNLYLQLKVQFFLTDIRNNNESNFIAIPGSHMSRVSYHHPYCLLPECNQYLERGELPPQAIQLKVNAGDILIHTLNLWHAVAPNTSSKTRRSISIRYGQMWFRNYYSYISEDITERLTPRQRRLLGDFGENQKGDIFYRPPDDHVPLILGDKSELYGWSMKWQES